MCYLAAIIQNSWCSDLCQCKATIRTTWLVQLLFNNCLTFLFYFCLLNLSIWYEATKPYNKEQQLVLGCRHMFISPKLPSMIAVSIWKTQVEYSLCTFCVTFDITFALRWDNISAVEVRIILDFDAQGMESYWLP